MGDIMDNFPIVGLEDYTRGQVGDEKLVVGALFNYATFHHLRIKVIIRDNDDALVSGDEQ